MVWILIVKFCLLIGKTWLRVVIFALVSLAWCFYRLGSFQNLNIVIKAWIYDFFACFDRTSDLYLFFKDIDVVFCLWPVFIWLFESTTVGIPHLAKSCQRNHLQNSRHRKLKIWHHIFFKTLTLYFGYGLNWYDFLSLLG